MTENEAIKRIKEQACNDRFLSIHCDDSCLYGAEKCEWAHAIQALEEIQQYRALEQKLRSVYGEHDGLLEIIVNGLVRYENAPDKAIKTVLLTDDDVEKWEAYKAIGTVEELQDLKEKNNKDFELLLKAVKESYPMFKGAYVELDVFMGDVMRRFARDKQ